MSYNQQSHDHARTMMGYVRQYGAELDTLKAEVALLGSELKHARDTVVDLDAEVDRLRAELAERNHAKYFSTIRKEVLACIDNGEIPGYCTISERDAAIARAEKLDSELGAHKASRIAYASEFDGDVGSIHQNIRAMKKDLGAARAAHAEAMELLERWREKSHPMNFGRSISEDTRAYLAKYGKDASK